MSFGIHALNVAYIVALLDDAPNPRGIRSGQAAREQATCGADGRAFRTAEDGTRCCSNAGAKAALFAALEAEAWPGVPPACSWAICLHVWSSIRNSSKLLPLPGNASMLGPVGMLTQAAIGNIAIKGNNLNIF